MWNFNPKKNLTDNKSVADIYNFVWDVNKTWSDEVKLYQPVDKGQILLPETASCLSVQTFLKMCNVKYEVAHKHNAEAISPSGQVPVLKCDIFLLSELETIVIFFERRGLSLTKDLDESQRAEMRAYMSLVSSVLANAEMYITWADQETYDRLTRIRFGSVYPWPLNWLLVRQKQQKVLKRLDALGWLDKTIEQVCTEVDTCCNALSNRLGGGYFFFEQPTELDAVLFAHVYTLLTTPLPKTQFTGIILSYPKIVEHCQRIIDEYFFESNSSHCIQNLDDYNVI